MFERLGSQLRDYLNKKSNDIFSNDDSNNINQNIEDLLDDGEEKPIEAAWHYESNSNSFGNTYYNNYSSNNYQNRQSSSQKTQKTYENSQNTFQQPNSNKQNKVYLKPYPLSLKNDFLKLGVTPGSPLEVCKNAQIQLLKKYHPDKFQNASQQEKDKATIMCSLVNESFAKIKSWYENKKI